MNMDEAEGEIVLQKKQQLYLKKFAPPDSDEEFVGDESRLYNVAKSWETLLGLPTCQKVMITESVQKLLGIEVGINVTQEFPWKHIKFKDLREHLFDELENTTEINKIMQDYPPDNYILIGYAPILTEQDDNPPKGDPFIFYISTRDAKMAMGIIQNIEAFERWRMRRRLNKKPRAWVSMGTEDEMNVLLQKREELPVDIEIQSVYPIKLPPHLAFNFRKSKDVRDGYIELLPSENVKFDNVTRRRITVAIQSAPELIDREQQTNPTFPSNSWSQYLYEIDDADLELDISDEEADDKGTITRSPATEPTNKPPPELSDQIKLLLSTLEFNQIDTYRNDYQFISAKQIEHYTSPYLEEFICFANISKSNKRYVTGYSWYPNLSGLIAVSYAFSTPATINEVSNRVDWVQQAVLEPNPILLWSFSDNLNYKLEFEAPIETTSLDFCPYNGDLLIGGSKNGQVIIWDLQGRADHLDEEEYLTAAQAKYRNIISEFLNWTIWIREDLIISPATITPLESSPKGAITDIYWLSNRYFINNSGKIYSDPDTNNIHKFFITCAIDGTINFWDLDSTSSKKNQSLTRSHQLPKELSQSESAFKNKTIKPTYSIGFNEPVTSVIADTTTFTCSLPNMQEIMSNPANYTIRLIAQEPPECRQSMILSTFYGHIHRVDWIGLYTDSREIVNSALRFAMVHDGPVIAMRKNPFFPQLFASIGRNVIAVWKEDYNYSPIFWRKRVCDLTAVAWSEVRPAVLYLTRIDGILEAWDILARDDDACLTEILGGGVITAITEHKPSVPYKILGIGDYNSSIRMVKLPETLNVPHVNELERVKEYVLSEERRKISIQEWEQKYYELNKDIIEAKREAEAEAEAEAHLELNREDQANQPKNQTEQQDEKTTEVKPLTALSYSERMARQWDELNLNRMMTILMSRKQMNPEKLARETALEKERLAYEHAKKESLSQLLLSISDDVATVRSRILPAEVPDLQRSEMIQARIKEELLIADSYENVTSESIEILQQFSEFAHIDYLVFLDRGRQRRKLLDQSLGANTERLLWYEKMNRDIMLHECNWGYDFLFTKSQPEQDELMDTRNEGTSDIIHFSNDLSSQ